jgi:cyclohexyl-isocyanide hydratase
MSEPFRIGMLLFPGLTQLDLTGPYEVLARMAGAKIHLIWKTTEPVRSEHGMLIVPDRTLAECPPLEMIFVPGGTGVNALMEDPAILEFLRTRAESARYVTSVCTGSLVLAAAGLLKGKNATTHWLSLEFLSALGAHAQKLRVVTDGKFITGAGVTSGIDFALAVAAKVCGEEEARAIQLMIEYDPAPPFSDGHPDNAAQAVLERVRRERAAALEKRREIVNRILSR